ncbi:conjugal transfer protein TraO [Maribacter sp. 4G9]|uniref:conjugal transfer protein TraO n=1 Tax=Maribacter sp. 4G9 TaxID=1889777 RepID=UPI000C15848C|nr:conjugal transfer protein TraO [Maribacter sp. 4G9]PIB39070.1 hypothetical protein BFP75_00920 [Maribacter sp. 4G9]
MKKIVCILMLSVQALCFSQESSLGISGGYTTNGFGVQAGYYNTLTDTGELQITLFASVAEEKTPFVDIPYNDISLNVGYFYKLVQDRYNRFHLALGGGGLVGYEVLNGGNNELDNGALVDGESKLIYGGFVGGELVYFISDTFALMGVANEFYHLNSDIGNLSFYGGLGVKYTLF